MQRRQVQVKDQVLARRDWRVAEGWRTLYDFVSVAVVREGVGVTNST